MVSILHISDLHFVKNAGTYNMERILLREAEEAVRGKGEGEKLLIVTGDFHNFKEEDYAQAGKFLKSLKDAMGLDMAKDVFVIPGNHDVGNDMTLDKALSGVDEFWKDNLDNNVARLKEGKRSPSIVNQRLRAFRPYSEFVRALGIYDEEPATGTDPDYPARVHVRCWRGKLNLLHLNTALAADGSPDKGNQVFDVDTAAKPETWEKLNTKDIPALALGHNSFFDLAEDEGKSMELRTALKAVFFDKNVSAYLCGDTHKKEKDGDRQLVRLGRGYGNYITNVPNIVCAKSIADMEDKFSDFGFFWHNWDESTDWVKLSFQRWDPSYVTSTISEGSENAGYYMRRSTPQPVEDKNLETCATSGSSDADADLRAYLAEVLRRMRDAHPSFRMMQTDEIDCRLFPGIKKKGFEQIPALGSIGKEGPVSSIWDIVQETWDHRPIRNVVIEGAGGIGKTTALFSLCNVGEMGVPTIYISLHQLQKSDGIPITISSYLKALNHTYGQAICRLAATPMGERPNLLVLLDGFNEVQADLRWEMLNQVNTWYMQNPGTQLVVVSRPMDGLNLGEALAGKPLAVTLAPLARETIRDYLQRYGSIIPPESAPIWKGLSSPLFLTLYLKTGALEGKSSAGYPLAPKRADSGGALIWNFLQRELLRQNDEGWVLRCAVACEYLLPRIAWEMTERHSFVLDQDEAIQWTEQALAELDLFSLPSHLSILFRSYERKHCLRRGTVPDFSVVNWPRTVLHDCGLLIPYQSRQYEANEVPRFTLIHQIFRDCLAALHLVNIAEGANGDLPPLWRRSHYPYVLDYAAELTSQDTLIWLWEAMRKLQPTNSAALHTQLELQKRRADGGTLDFSRMDLQGISLAAYLRWRKDNKPLFRESALFDGAKLGLDTFRFQGHTSDVTCVAVFPDRRCVSGSNDRTLRVWDSDTGECQHTLEGHGKMINCVEALPDGRCISGSEDGTLRVWDIVRGECQHILKGHSDSVICVAALPDGRCVSGSWDKTLRVWDSRSGKCLHILEGHTASITCIAVLPNECCISGSEDGTLRVWDCHTGQCQNIMSDHIGWIRCIVTLPNNICVSGSSDHTIRVWNYITWKCLHILEGHSAPISCVATLLDGCCVSGSEDGTLRIWDSESGECKHVLEGHNGWVRCVTALPDGHCVSGSDDGTLRVWDSASGECKRILDGHINSVRCVAALPDGRCVSGSWDKMLRVWDSVTGECLHILEGHSSWNTCVATLPDGRFISGSWDKTLRIWNKATGECQHILEGHSAPIACVVALPDGRCVSGSHEKTMRVWDSTAGECQRVLAGHRDRIFCVAALPDGRCVSGSGDRTLRVWDINTGECQIILQGHKDWVRCAVASPDGCFISGSDDKTLRVWDSKSGACLHVLAGHRGSVSCVAALPDGRIVSGSADGTLRVWDSGSGECLQVLEGNSVPVYCVAALPDGRCVSGSWDHTLRVWDCGTGECLRVMEGHSASVTCVAALPDGRFVSGSRDNTLRIWDPDTGECLDILEAMDVDVRGMDFSRAILTPDLAKQLWQNGAKISDADYQNHVLRKP